MCVIVVDTNVLIEAIYHGDEFSMGILRLVDSGEVRALLTDDIEEELVLTFFGHAIQAHLSLRAAKPAILKMLRFTQSAERLSVAPTFTGCLDPDDNKFLDCAIAGKAKCIITLDSHLQAPDLPIPAVSPWQFIRDRKRVSGRA